RAKYGLSATEVAAERKRTCESVDFAASDGPVPEVGPLAGLGCGLGASAVRRHAGIMRIVLTTLNDGVVGGAGGVEGGAVGVGGVEGVAPAGDCGFGSPAE